MSGLMAFNRLAAERGDGLLPQLRDLLEYRATRIEGDPDVVDISAVRADGMVQAGPYSDAKAPVFLPENVIQFAKKAPGHIESARKKI